MPRRPRRPMRLRSGDVMRIHRASMRRLVDYAYRGNLAGVLDPHHSQIASITTPGERPQHRSITEGTVLVALHRDGSVHAYTWDHKEPKPLRVNPVIQEKPWPRGALRRVDAVMNSEGKPMTILDFRDYITLPEPPIEPPKPRKSRGAGRLDRTV